MVRRFSVIQGGLSEAAGAALIDGTAAQPVATVLRGRLPALRRPIAPSAPLDAAPAPARPQNVLAFRRPAAVRRIPAGAMVGVRPEGWEPPPEAERESVSAPVAIRDAVESVPALDARTAPSPIVADPPQAPLVRVVSRLFARRDARRVDLLRRAGDMVAGTLHRGAGASATAWLRARA